MEKTGIVFDNNTFIKFDDGTYIDLDPGMNLNPVFDLKDGDEVVVSINIKPKTK